MNVHDAPIRGVKVIEPSRFADDRGWFMELWNADRYRDAGLPAPFVQTNVSLSRPGVLRGMHFQAPHPQGKLVSVPVGAVFDVVVDLRTGSDSFGRWYGCELSGENRMQLWVPEGFAHGFLVVSENAALVHYSCTVPYRADSDRSLAWDDPDVGIAWPTVPDVVSDKDRSAPTLRDLERAGTLNRRG